MYIQHAKPRTVAFKFDDIKIFTKITCFFQILLVHLLKITKMNNKAIEITIPEGMKLVEIKNENIETTTYQIVVNDETSEEQDIETFMSQFLNNLTLISTDKYPKFTFFKQHDKYLFLLYQNEDNKNFIYVNYETICSPLMMKFFLTYQETMVFIKDQIEKRFMLDDITVISSEALDVVFNSSFKHIV